MGALTLLRAMLRMRCMRFLEHQFTMELFRYISTKFKRARMRFRRTTGRFEKVFTQFLEFSPQLINAVIISLHFPIWGMCRMIIAGNLLLLFFHHAFFKNIECNPKKYHCFYVLQLGTIPK